MTVLLTLFALQQAPVPTSTIARIAISPAQTTVAAGDTVQYSAIAYDAAGAPIRDARVTFRQAGGDGVEIDSTGRLIAGNTGTAVFSVVALRTGERPRVERREVTIVPGPAQRIALRTPIPPLVVGQRLTPIAAAYSSLGDERKDDAFRWTSSNPRVAQVMRGVLVAKAPGRATLTVTSGRARRTVAVRVLPVDVARIDLTPPQSEARTGDVLRLKAIARDRRGQPIRSVVPHWSFAGGDGLIEPDGAFVGYRPGTYTITAALGNRTATATVRLRERDVRRAVTVVGRLPRTEFTTAEVWIHPNGKVAYLGAHGGGDRFWSIDISNPAKPVVVDSVVMNTRLVNDIMTTADGRYLVATREGAADRKNGIVLCSLDDPLHPKVISEFTDGVTSGVHSAFVYTSSRFGTHVYLTNDGTGALHIIDINDPYKPVTAAIWKTPRADAGRYLHDIDVQDGLLYGSWWNDGLVILDVGNGIKGGTPSRPQFVSQYKYDLNEMYREVEIASSPGFGRGTHTAWRHKNYVFIADEVYLNGTIKGAKDAASSRMYGNLQVIDVSDIQNPKAVAYYKPEYGGVHNVWVAGDTLYMGAYDGGFRVFDISGELRGDLRAAGREIAHVHTADMDGNVKNQAQTWGVVVNKTDGLAYVNDFYNGLWVVRIEPRRQIVP